MLFGNNLDFISGGEFYGNLFVSKRSIASDFVRLLHQHSCGKSDDRQADVSKGHSHRGVSFQTSVDGSYHRLHPEVQRGRALFPLEDEY